MFSLVKIVLWFIFFFAWLFGKLRWNEIRTTFQDWFPFLYFIYLFLVVILPDNVQGFNFIGFVVFFFFVISIYKDFFRGLRYFISQLRVGNKSIERFDKIKRYLFKEKLEDVSEFLLAIVLIGLMYIQINYATPTISLVNKSNVELLGFIVSIFGMYGIYIGFLQYLAGDVKSDTYLGESKVNYLIGQSFWYHVTQSKIFILMLLAAIIIPVTVKLNTAFIKELTILWQTSYMLLLVIYIFLLSMSLYIIRVALLMKTKDDENLKYNMRKQIQEDYTEYLLHSGKVNLSDVIDNISVVSLFRLEWILRWNYYQYTRESNYTSRTFFDTMTSNSRYYWSGGDGILEFYIVKIIDNFYHDLYQDREFIDGFKYRLESQLNSLNKTVEEYVESIAKKISGINNISILQKGQILLNLNDILHYQSKWVELKPKRKYRYK